MYPYNRKQLMKRLVILCLLFRALAVFAEDIEMLPVVIPTARNNGMGGDHVAYTDNVYALLVNPAAILQVRQNGMGAFSASLIDPVKTFNTLTSLGDMIWGVFNGDMGAFAKLLEIYTKKGGKPLGFDLREFPLSFAWVSNGLGVGIWNRIFIDQTAVGSQTQHNLYCDVVLPISVAFPIVGTDSHSLDIGITLKPFARIIVQGELDEPTLTSDDLDPASFDTHSIPLIAGTGIDAGLLYRWDKGFSAGFTVNDIITRGRTINTLRGDSDNDYHIPMTMNLGVAYELKIGTFFPTVPDFLGNTGITVAADWRDILAVFWQDNTFKYQNIWQKINAGIEVTLLDMIMVRCGISNLQFVAGAGINIASFQIDASYSTKEFRNKSEHFTAPVLELTFCYRPRAKESNWFWAQNPLIGYSGSNNKEED